MANADVIGVPTAIPANGREALMAMDGQADRVDPALWRAASFENASDCAVVLSDGDRREILAAPALRAHAPAREIADLTKADFGFDSLSTKLATAEAAVRKGRGFVVLRGLPLDGLTIEQFATVVWGVGLHFGSALSQNAQGERITHAVDATAVDPTPRMYRSNMELRLHTDITAMISLACWQQAETGGVSVITSGVTVHDEIRRRAPHLLEPLYRGFHYHRLGEEGPGEAPVTPHRVPVFAVHNGQVSVRYQRSGIVGGHRTADVPLTPIELEAMDLFDAVARAPENRLVFQLARGDMVVLNNYTVMHARTGFTNFPEPERKRLLVRLWLDAEGFRDVPDSFKFFAINGVPKQTGKRATYDFKKLYADDPVATGGLPDLQLTDAEVARAR
jgi:alpha-ketoglutarate-dependent taurine dioxygenase